MPNVPTYAKEQLRTQLPGSSVGRCLRNRNSVGLGVADGRGCLCEEPMMRLERVVQRLTHVAQQVPPIGDLDGSWCGLPSGFRIDPSTVSTDDLRTRVLSKPGGYGLGLAIRQQVDDLLRLQIAQNGSIAVTFSPGPVVDAKHARSLGWSGSHPPAYLTQQSRTTPRQSKTTRQASAGLSSYSKRDPVQRFGQPEGSPRVACDSTRHLCGEDRSPAAPLDTEELAHLQEDQNRQLLPGKVAQLAKIAAVDPP